MNNEALVDWIIASFISLFIWCSGYSGQHSAQSEPDPLIRLPTWLAILVGRVSGDNLVPVRNFTIQMDAILLFLLVTFLALFEPDHQKRVQWFGIGLVVFLITGSIFLGIVLFRQRHK